MPIALTSTISSSGTSSLAMVIPDGAAADDIFVMSVLTRSSAALTITHDNGQTWTEKSRVFSTIGLSCWWLRAATDLSGSTVHVNGGANSIVGNIVSYSGAVTTGDPFETHVSTIQAVTTSNGSLAAITALSSGAMIVLNVGEPDDRVFTTSAAGGTPSSLATRANTVTAVGLDLGLVHTGNLIPSSGATGTFTWSFAAGSGSFAINASALTPAGAGGGGGATLRLWRMSLMGVGCWMPPLCMVGADVGAQ